MNQPKWIPLRYAPISLELELVNQPTDVCILGVTGRTGFTASELSQEWSIENVQVKCDVCTLDNALDNSYVEHLLSGKNLPINYNTYISQIQAVTGRTGLAPADLSQAWEIENVQVKCDVCTLDNALDNSYVEHLLSGKTLPINYNTYIS